MSARRGNCHSVIVMSKTSAAIRQVRAMSTTVTHGSQPVTRSMGAATQDCHVRLGVGQYSVVMSADDVRNVLERGRKVDTLSHSAS